MKKRMTKLLSLFTATMMVTSALTGCGSKEEETQTAQTSANESSASVESTSEAASEGVEEFSYPMESGHTVVYWMELNSAASANFLSMDETEFGKALQEQTGIEIEYQHPASGQAKEQFNLMLADGNLPDIIEWKWLTDYTGGPAKAIEDGVVIPLNDIIDEYCPNLKAYLEEHPDIDKEIKTDDGQYYMFPTINGTRESFGGYIREDWLKELNLEIPASMDDWYHVLTVFKNEKGTEAPLSIAWSALITNSPWAYAYGVGGKSFVVEEDTVVYAPISDGYKEFLTTLNKWYEDGLLDPELATIKNTQVTAKIATGLSGASAGYLASAMQVQITAGIAEAPEFSLVATPVPEVTEGVAPEYANTTRGIGAIGAAITTQCEDIEAAARLLDYCYAGDGLMLFNYGIEGVSYEMVDGNPVYTDEIFNNPDGLEQSAALGKYQRASYNGPGIQLADRYKQTLLYENTQNARETWQVEGAVDHVLPALTLTTEESSEYATIMNEITTYVDEWTLKFVMGTESLDNWDTYVQTIQQFGITRATEIQQAAYDRYLVR